MKVKKSQQIIKKSRKRQWGTEKDMSPLSAIHDHPSTLKLAFSRIAIYLTAFFWVSYILSTVIRQFINRSPSYSFTMEAISYSIVVSLLTLSALIYLLARHGALQRFAKHVRVPHSVLDKHFSENQSDITVLVPSYDEESAVVRKTLLSAALQEYPTVRIVLLIDDKPNPTDPDVLNKLNETRAIAGDIQTLLSVPYKRFSKALTSFERAGSKGKSVTQKEVRKLAQHYEWAAGWLYELANKEEINDHVDVFFTDQILRELANDFRLIGEALTISADENAKLLKDRITQLYQRLVWTFQAELSYFERKKYASLSKEVNKAMNLNSYIGLMGGSYNMESTPDGPVLVPVKKGEVGDLTIPDSDFLLTLDADSILLRDYCLRLVYLLQQPGNERVAVTQTPYSSFRGAYSRIERLSGATTDVQHILHQGMSYYGATFWVGANAIIRKVALEDIVEKEWVGGFEIKRYIQDRTVIEDTESSVDLVIKGWTLMNYPERLSYSATPPDFGSLVIQRRRWANGGLLILAKLWKQIREGKSRNEIISWAEVMLRINYMASIAWSSFGLIILLVYPFDNHLLSPLVSLAALPYFISMAYDLKYCGYSFLDIFSIYGFNLILLPVNLAGVLKSIEQGITGKKIPFARTPKINNRTSAGLQYVVVPVGIVLFSVYILWVNIQEGNVTDAVFAGFNAVAGTWAIFAYIGIDGLITDIWLGLTNWLYVEKTPKVALNTQTQDTEIDWKVVLYHGEKDGKVPHTSLNNLVAEQANISGKGK